MPTPSQGAISFTDIEAEFKRVNGAPSAISEYSGRPGSSAEVASGVEGVATSGPVSFSDFRGKTAHLSASKAISVFKNSFGTTPVKLLRSAGTSNAGGVNATYKLLFYNPAVYNSSEGGANDGNLQPEDRTITLNVNKTEIDEDALVTRGNTVVFIQSGKGGAPGQWNYSGNSIIDFAINGLLVTPVFEEDAPGKIHAAGYPNQGITNSPCRTCTAVYNQPLTSTLQSLNSASFKNTGRDWNGNDGGGNSNTTTHRITLVLPGRWQRYSNTLYGVGAGSIALGPYEIAIVTNAQDGPSSNVGAAPYTLSRSSGSSSAPSTITPVFFGELYQWTRYTFGIYLNETEYSATYNLASAKYAPYVQIFKFIGDGYMTSLIV